MICVLRGLADGDRGRRPVRTGRRDHPIIQLPSVALRVAIVVGVALCLLAVILFRLWFLQILSGEQFVAQANDNRLRSVKVVAPRGAIVDRRGKVVVENRPGLAIGIRPMDIPEEELDQVVRRLAKVLDMPPKRLQRRVDEHQGPAYDLIVVKEDVGRRAVSYLLERKLSFPGVEIRRAYLRSYPNGTRAAHLLGNVGEIDGDELKQKRFKGYRAGDVIGKSGLEWTYDRWLRGRDGVAKVEVDAFGQPKASEPVAGGRLPAPGETLVTTLDLDIQARAEDALIYGMGLARKAGHYRANGGAVVVLDPNNGEIIAMASYPTFDPDVWVGGISPKDYRRLADTQANRPLINRATQSATALASTFKVVPAIAGLEEGVISPHTTHYCPGSFSIPWANDDIVWNCWERDGHGTLDLYGALAQSCDVYFYNVGLAFYGRKGTELADWAGRVGLGKLTGIDIPGEVAGRVPTPEWRRSYFESEVDKLWTPGNSVNLSIGQGDLEGTPLQLAVTYAAIANGGHIVTPHLGKKIVNAAGETVRDLDPGTPKKVDISATTLEAVHRGLRQAASPPSGTSGVVFNGYPVAVAGKTGTAEVFGSDDYAWYASYAPADDPKYVVVVMIEQGGGGGAVAAPTTRYIYDRLFKVKSESFSGTVRSD